MISEDKVKLMTSIAILEKREGKHCFSINRYFRSDYISKHMIRAFVIYTIAVCFCLLLWLICNVEAVMEAFSSDGLIALGKTLGFYYTLGLVLYLFVAYWVYYRRYEYASRKLKVYAARLKTLDKRYEFQDKTRRLAREGHKL